MNQVLMGSARAASVASDPNFPLLALDGIDKTYGSTRANADICLQLQAGEVLGLIGANGAGKSTLMRIVCGVTAPDAGTVAIGGARVDQDTYSPSQARSLGVRIVWQELSLASNLTVAENFYVEQPQFARISPRWLQDYHRLARQSIERIFPGARIPTTRLVGDLTLAERQMVEIARAASDPKLRLLILDEPTSSLGAERSGQLRDFVRTLSRSGTAVIFISHKLAEVLEVADRVVAMRNGRIGWSKPAKEARIGDLVEAMGGVVSDHATSGRAEDAAAGGQGRVLVRYAPKKAQAPLELRAGEVIGLAGLEGSGQKELLQEIFGSGRTDAIWRQGSVRYVSGDRQREGVFPLWSVLDNIAIGRIAQWPALRPLARAGLHEMASGLARRLALDETRLDSNILDLSGGNQQKALVARALAEDADIILLDDPTRGVDIAAKRDFYRLAREIASSGRLVIWHSTEDLEFLECDRVLVFSGGEVAAELSGQEISEEAIVASSFAGVHAASTARSAAPRGDGRWGALLLRAVPFISLAVVFAVMASLNPLVASTFGLELLLAPAVTLVLVALAQMFVVGGSEIDLGAGAFTGLVNVISATLLVTAPLLGLAGLAAGLAGYAIMAVLIQARAIPAIVVTLGASFIWLGLGHTLQPSPGGSAPEWLRGLFTWSVPGLPTPLLLVTGAGLLAFLIDRSPSGTILRGFGSSPLALQRAGWSPLRFSILRYCLAGLFAMAAGLYVTASNGASDINAGSSFTLLSIAAVVIGGCRLLGGFISPLGVTAGAVTLSLIGALLASLGVSTDYNAAVQGALLIAILALQALASRGRDHD